MWMLESLRAKRLIESRSAWTREQVLAHQRSTLRTLLRHVWDESPFYRDYYGDHGIREADLESLEVTDLPRLDKEKLMDGFDRLSRDPVLRRAPIEQWLHSGAENPYLGRYVVIHTSGSSGNMGIFVYDKVAWSRPRGIMMAHSTLGRLATPFNRIRVAMCAATHGHFGAVTSAKSFPRALFDVRLCSVLDPISKTVATLNDLQPEMLGGYATTLHALAEQALAGHLVIHPTNVTPAGESLTREAAEAIEKAWGIAPMEIYASSESPCLALRQPGDDKMRLMEDEHIFEFLDAKDEPVGPGETGRVVMTTLYNRVMPLIRYEMRDYATRATRATRAENERFDSILRVEGRVNDALPVAMPDGSEDAIHPIVLSEFFVPGARTFQFLSTSPSSITIRYVADGDRDETVRADFAAVLQRKRADPAIQVRVERVEALPIDARTGKFRLVVLGGGAAARH